MKKAKHVLTRAQSAELTQVIAEVEKSTNGEIVPVIATSSGDYYHANFLIGFILALITFCILWNVVEVEPLIQWSEYSIFAVQLPFFVITQIIAFICGVLLARFFPSLKLLFISKKEMHLKVERAAREAFFNLKIGKTQAETGVVIYVSLYEHMVVVQGDRAISERLSSKEWHEIKDLIIVGIRKKQLAEGLKQAILLTGKLLAKHFPSAKTNPDELANKLHLLD